METQYRFPKQSKLTYNIFTHLEKTATNLVCLCRCYATQSTDRHISLFVMIKRPPVAYLTANSTKTSSALTFCGDKKIVRGIIWETPLL